MRLGDGQHAEEEAVGGSPAAAPFLYFTDALDGEQDDLREGRYYGGSLKQLHRKPRATCDARTAARALVLALAMGCVFWAARFLAFRPTAYVTAVFARPLIPNPLPVEHLVVPFPRRASPSEIHTQFEDRLAAIGSSPSTLPCVWRDGDDVKYAGLKRRGRYLFALNLWNNQVVFPSLARTLLSLASFLGEDNVHVSIFENGSTDNTTIAMAHFAAALTALGADHTIVSDQRRTDWSRVDRIAQLAIFRNIVLLPLNQSSLAGEFEEVVFINDVFACPRDALELLYQKHRQNAHAACATDWRATQSWIAWLGYRSVKLYDNCESSLRFLSFSTLTCCSNAGVSRSVTGDMLRSRLDVLAETRDGIMELFDQPGAEYSRERFQAGLPVPVCTSVIPSPASSAY